MRGTAVIFVKAPRAGQVKTRLGASVGMARAAALFRIMTARTIAEAGRGDWRVVLAVDPSSATSGWENIWPTNIPRIAQGGGDLGDRMARVLRHAPQGPVVIIGADAPGLRARHIRVAFRSLNGNDAIIGPATDGGYWLIGLARRRAAQSLFANVRWSTKHALADTLASLPAGFSIDYLETLADIDEAADLRHFGLRSVVR